LRYGIGVVVATAGLIAGLSLHQTANASAATFDGCLIFAISRTNPKGIVSKISNENDVSCGH
jgi:hypothetical protein